VKYLRIKNWDKYQAFKDREPKWIKVYRSLLNDYDFCQLTDSARGHLICLWLLAAETDNKIAYDANWIKSRINATSKIDLIILINHGFLEVYEENPPSVQPTPDVCTDDPDHPYSDPESVVHREEERREEKRRDMLERAFCAMWEIYPRKVSKQEARKSWEKLSPTEDDARLIIKRLRLHVGKWTDDRTEAKHIPHAATWLNRRRWEDDLDSSIPDQREQAPDQRPSDISNWHPDPGIASYAESLARDEGLSQDDAVKEALSRRAAHEKATADGTLAAAFTGTMPETPAAKGKS